MLLIFISWLYILFTVVNFGLITHKFFRINKKDFVITAFSGLFFITLLAGFWAVFWRINLEFHIFLLVLNTTIFLKFKSDVQDSFLSVFSQIKKLPVFFKIIFLVFTFLIIAQCASIPYVIDNESYYIQTIKWLNEYGFVKGLANLHLFLGQMSGWHITQSVFNFSFLYENFNDLSGFCLWLGNLFAILRLSEYFQNQKIHYLLIGMLPLANLFFFQFISAPSPDIPVFVFSLIIFFYFIDRFSTFDIESFQLITLLVLFTLLIKPTSAVLALIPVFVLMLNFKVILPRISSTAMVAVLVLSLFILKNSIISGYPLYPLTFFSMDVDFALPDFLSKFYYDQTRLSAFHITAAQKESLSFYQLFIHWLNLSKLHGIFNKIALLLVLICPFLIFKWYNKKQLWILYALMVIQLLFLAHSSPQYRFFMNFILLFVFFVGSLFIKKKKILYAGLLVSVIITSIFLLADVNLSAFTDNRLVTENSRILNKNIVYPYPDSKYNSDFEKVKEGNLEYYSLQNNPFFWASGDGSVPCVNKEQIAYFKTYFEVVPQQRTTHLKDGFYSKMIENE